MPKRTKPAEDPKEQFKRFLETAEENKVDAAAAEGAFKNMTSATTKKPKKTKAPP